MTASQDAASRARALDRARALLAEPHQLLEMDGSAMYKLVTRYQRSLSDLIRQLDEDSP